MGGLVKRLVPPDERSPKKYASTLMRVMNVWRDHGAVVYFAWQQIDPKTAHLAHTVPPKCIPT
eukprot:1380245-Pyramimonas_sp.AAC.1